MGGRGAGARARERTTLTSIGPKRGERKEVEVEGFGRARTPFKVIKRKEVTGKTNTILSPPPKKKQKKNVQRCVERLRQPEVPRGLQRSLLPPCSPRLGVRLKERACSGGGLGVEPGGVGDRIGRVQ